VGTSPPALVADLVDRFSRDSKVFQSLDYKEEQLRDTAYGRQLTAFRLRPSDSDSGRSAASRKPIACSACGWDVSNKAGLTEVLMPVIHEESIKIAGASKTPACAWPHADRPDYTFRIGGHRRHVGLMPVPLSAATCP